MTSFLKELKVDILKEANIRSISPLVYAYIGDAIYEVYIRTYVIKTQKKKVYDLHKGATKFVKASAQSKIVHALKDYLTEEEWQIVKRGRNQKSGTVPKNANISDYKYATGYEALLGYLFLREEEKRLEEIIKKSIEIIEGI